MNESYGVGWPNGPTDNAKLINLTGPLLMLSTEHWHVQEALDAGKHVLYRVVPPLDKRPARLGWSHGEYMSMLISEVHDLPITDLIPWNELDLQDERGDNKNDFEDLDARYTQIADFANRLLPRIRAKWPNVKIHWPAFTPDHQALEHIMYWGHVADQFDVIDFHEYMTVDNIHNERIRYNTAFPDKHIVLTEWHAKGNLEEEKRILQYLTENGQEAYFFIYEWFNAPEDWTNYDLAHNPERYQLFSTIKDHTMTTTDPNAPLRQYGLDKAKELGLPIDKVDKQFQQESGWKHWNTDGSIITSSSGAMGVCQIIPRWHPTVNINDPYACIDYALNLMLSAWKKRNSYKLALMDYNWGPGNVNTWIKAGSHDDQIPIETHKYLDVVLGLLWTDIKYKQETVPVPQHEYHFGFKDIADRLGADVVGKPLTEEKQLTATVQFTEKGMMLYDQESNTPYFFPAVR